MIKLDVREYCDRCPHFEPEVVERPRVYILTNYSFCGMVDKRMAVTHGDTVVKCCNRDRCEAIYEYMEGQKKC
jgi:hypothetical protein